MVERDLAYAVVATGGRLLGGEPQQRFRGIAIDSRKVSEGTLFFALRGSRVDGHDYLDDALSRGAAAVVVERDDLGTNGPAIRVRSVYDALHDLTRAVRKEVPERLAGVTGSVGKTTTKELLADMLEQRFRTARSPGNLNNLYGFPLSLLGIDDDCQWMVAEMGMSTPGELSRISQLGRPDLAVYTNVRPAHLENFNGLRGIADAKAELLDGLPAAGLVVANADDPWVMRIAQRHPGRVISYGRQAEVRAVGLKNLETGPGTAFQLHAGGDSVEVELPLHGRYNVDNCLAAAAAAWAVGVSLDQIASAAAKARPSGLRGQVETLPGGVTLVNDVYNSNPEAAKRALEALLELSGRRRMAVLGDMLELGKDGPSMHAAVGQYAAELGLDLLIGVGELSQHTVQAAHAAGLPTEHFATAAEAGNWVARALRAGDVVLAKGSRSVQLESAVASLRTALTAAAADSAGQDGREVGN